MLSVFWWTHSNQVPISTIFFHLAAKRSGQVLLTLPTSLLPYKMKGSVLAQFLACNFVKRGWISTWINFVPVRIASLSQKYTEALHEGTGWVKLDLALLFRVCKRQRQMFQLRTSCWEHLGQREGGRKHWMMTCFFLWLVWGILLQEITITVRFIMLVCHIYFVSLLISLLWLGYTMSSLHSLRLFMEFAMWRAIE